MTPVDNNTNPRPASSPVSGPPAAVRNATRAERSEQNSALLHALCALRPRVTALRLRALLAAAGSPERAWQAEAALLTTAGWSDDARTAFLEHRARWNVAAEADRLAEQDITLIPLESTPGTPNAAYPALLREIYDPPIALYVRGHLSRPGPVVAVVGSRKASPYGRTVTASLVKPLAARSLTIVSGLAYGIDAEAHRAALSVNGHTVSVLGSGVDEPSLYPRAHRTLARDIVAAGGAVISEFPPGTGARAEYFPQRNRIIAGLSHAVVIVEADTTSGALITARLALAENREVLAVPGPITSPLSEGTNRLLQAGAAPACSADDILEALALEEVLRPSARPAEARRETALAASERAPAAPALQPGPWPAPVVERVLGLLSAEPKSIDEVVAVSTLPTHEVSATLSLLELRGQVRDVGGKQYVRC